MLSKVGSFAYQLLAVPVLIASLGSGGYSCVRRGPVGVRLARLGVRRRGRPVIEQVASDRSRPVSQRTRETFVTALAIDAVPGLLAWASCCSSGLAGTMRRTRRRSLWPAGHRSLAAGSLDAPACSAPAVIRVERSQLVSSLGAVVATVVAAVLAPTVAAMILATLGPVILARVVSGLALRRLEPSLRGGLRDIRWRRAPSITGRGLAFRGISLASFLSLDAGLLVVASQLGSTNVAEVALVVRGLPLVLSVVGMIITPLWPAITEAAGSGDLHWVARRAAERRCSSWATR
jgi:hypothetical protein